MSTTNPPRVRKRLLVRDSICFDTTEALDIAACATIAFSSEDPDHPVESLLDDHAGPGGSYWSSAHVDTAEQLVVEFDAPQSVSRLLYEVEEMRSERTQEVRVEASQDGGLTFRGLLIQEYTFSPRGATFQREDIRLHPISITHLRVTIVPNKSGSGKATLTSLRLFPNG
jgi:hypothetical protein